MDLYNMGLRPTSPTRPITPDCPRGKHSSKFGMWQKLQHFFGRDGSLQCVDSDDDGSWSMPDHQKLAKKGDGPFARPVGIGLPRKTTFKRQNSEKRDRLCPVELSSGERRAYSMSRAKPSVMTKFRTSSVPPTGLPTRRSAPAVPQTFAVNEPSQQDIDMPPREDESPEDPEQPAEYDRIRPPRPASITSSVDSYDDQRDHFEDRLQLNRELDTKWILNLSMHFKDKSDREKFFVTYAETPSRWRRVTVSCDYRHAEPGSLEMDLKELQLQRDKSMQIYESIRDSLAEIKFYDTVTNLKLETTNGRLHVHVTEDVNEIIPYPPVSSIQHILQDSGYRPAVIREGELSFDSHLSGFVYKVMYRDKAYIKKEIPGPDTVDEFLYEVNALSALQDSRYVIDLEAVITDESGELIKGLLINYAERGAVVDLLYDYKGEISWEDRERWARQAVQGLSDIHEEGYVQGDFTLSNIVVDKDNNARIIDINRRGCPVGWEPPEIAKKIASNQRISMYIGQKSDVYQLGMTLWALAMDDDEPERHDPPLSTQEFPADVPEWYQDVVRNCLSFRPRDRSSATDLIRLFPLEDQSRSWSSNNGRPVVHIRTEKKYIDPAAAVERDDLERFRYERNESDEILYSPESSRGDPTFTWPQSSNYDRDYDSGSSEIERPRGRRRISDHDLMLQARRENEREFADSQVIDDRHSESTPIISISADGGATHIIDMTEEPEPIEIEMFPDEETTGRHQPSLSYLSERRFFHPRSERSDETPRNSSLRHFDLEAHSPENVDILPQSDPMPDDLAGMGCHPNLSENSLGQIRHDERAVNHDMPQSPFSQQFTNDSFDEPPVIEIELDSEPIEAHEESENSKGDTLVNNEDHIEDTDSNFNTSPLLGPEDVIENHDTEMTDYTTSGSNNMDFNLQSSGLETQEQHVVEATGSSTQPSEADLSASKGPRPIFGESTAESMVPSVLKSGVSSPETHNSVTSDLENEHKSRYMELT